MDDKTKITLWAVTLVVALDAWALYLGYDGAIMATVIGGVLLAAGVKVGQIHEKAKKVVRRAKTSP